MFIAEWLVATKQKASHWWGSLRLVVRWRKARAIKCELRQHQHAEKLLRDIDTLKTYNTLLLLGKKGTRLTMRKCFTKLERKVGRLQCSPTDKKRLSTALQALRYVVYGCRDPDCIGQSQEIFDESGFVSGRYSYPLRLPCTPARGYRFGR